MEERLNGLAKEYKQQILREMSHTVEEFSDEELAELGYINDVE